MHGSITLKANMLQLLLQSVTKPLYSTQFGTKVSIVRTYCIYTAKINKILTKHIIMSAICYVMFLIEMPNVVEFS